MGDRYVLEAMKAGGYTLGGEQSGHVIMLDHATTGDGAADRRCTCWPGGRPRPSAGRAGHGDDPPAAGPDQRQGRRQVPVAKTSPELAAAVEAAEAELGETGRVLIRPSGTESGACEPVCPVEAIYYEDDVPDQWTSYTQINADFFAELGSPGGASKVGQTDNDPQVVKDLPPQGED